MDRFPRPLRTPQGRHRRLRPVLCHRLHPRTRLPSLPAAAARSRARLVQIRDNLISRIAEAETHHWLGEAEGLKVSLAGAHAKLDQMDQITARRTSTVQLGIPSFTDTAGRNITGETSSAHLQQS